ncbi:MAG: hypothetical protein H7Y04_15280, partial [Verrucomicrobia bacterium]|nr:hypothetical protein [Cytophagales bacterium]
TTSDYLDDVSTNYNLEAVNSPDPIRAYFANRESNPISADFAKRGDPSDNDGYFLLNLKLEYNTIATGNYGKQGRTKFRKTSSRKRR